MNRIFDFCSTWLLNAVSFFGNLRQQRHDDPLLAEYKAKQRACLWSFVPFVVVVLVGWVAGTFMNVIDGFQVAQSVVASYRDWLGPAFLVAAVLTVVYAAWVGISLVRFVRQHGIE